MKHLKYILFSILAAIFLKVFAFELYKIPSGSMQPTLEPGDYIIVQKITYGARLIKWQKFFKEKKLDYVRTLGFTGINKGDIVVFNWPNYDSCQSNGTNLYGDVLVKRCAGTPGCNIHIHKEIYSKYLNPNDVDSTANLFPYNPLIHWKLSNYGPLLVPGKGVTVAINKKNIALYRQLFKFENRKIQVNDSVVLLNNSILTKYTFTHNYYFMLGDNFYESADSRFWGFVPDVCVIGKVMLVL